jgi:hypothetical protein
MKIKILKQYNIAYALIPFLRNQDIIEITPGTKEITFAASVIDGWNNKDELSGNEAGKKVAELVATRFPEIFLDRTEKDWQTRAEKTAELMDQEILNRWPAYVSCVGSFLFSERDKNVLLTIGSVVVFVWNGQAWKRPKEIGDYSLDPQKYPSDVSRFIGRGELKQDSFYSAKPDVAVLPKDRPILIASDGLEDIFTPQEFNQITQGWDIKNPQEFISNLLVEIKIWKHRQKDDISILFKS